MADDQFMKRAIKLAEKGRGKTSPNPMVGAVLVKNGQIIAEGHHEAPGKPHAEVLALNKAGNKARHATLYVTLEPCCIWGRTPPCTGMIINAKVAEVVVGLIDPNPKVSGKGIRELRMAGIEVKTDLLADEIAVQNEKYVCYMSKGRPFVMVKVAASLDGKTATTAGESQWISGEQSRQQVHRFRDEYDAVLVGIGTVLKDDPLLTTRIPNRKTRNPVRVIIDSEAKISFNTRIVTTAREVPTIIATTERAPMEKMKTLQELGLSVLVLPSRNGRLDLIQMFRALAEREISSVMVESGAELNAALFEAGLVDKLTIFYAPKVIGGLKAPGMVEGRGIENLSDALNFDIAEIKRLGDDLMVVAYPKAVTSGQ